MKITIDLRIVLASVVSMFLGVSIYAFAGAPTASPAAIAPVAASTSAPLPKVGVRCVSTKGAGVEEDLVTYLDDPKGWNPYLKKMSEEGAEAVAFISSAKAIYAVCFRYQIR